MNAGVKLGYILINIDDQQVLFDNVFILLGNLQPI